LLIESTTIPIASLIAMALGGYAYYRNYHGNVSPSVPNAVAVTTFAAEAQETFNYMYQEEMKIVGVTTPEMD
jgi:hypothetical protein